MTNWVFKRLGQAALTVLVVFNLSFVLMHMMPGGPRDYIRQRLMNPETGTADPERVDRLVQLYTNVSPSDSLWQQYIDYMSSVMVGDLGHSMSSDVPVAELLAQALPWTTFIMAVALIITFTTGIVLGALMAYYEGERFDIGMTMVSIVQQSMPYYVAAILLVYVFAYQSGYFPETGRYPSGVDPGFTVEFVSGSLYHAALPITSMIITGFAGASLSMRGNAISVLGSDYIRVANLRGLTPTRISLRYVMRNALLPMYTGLLLGIGFMFGGSIILEQIFAYRGLGWYTFRGVAARDYPLMMGGFVVITLAVVLAMIVADLTYGKVDPRAEGEGERETYAGAGGVPLHTQLRRMAADLFKRSEDHEGGDQLLRGDGGSVGGGRSQLQWLGDDEETSADITRMDAMYNRVDRSLLAPARIVWSDWRGKLGLALTVLFLFAGIFGQQFVKPPHVRGERFVQPFQTMEYPLGTNDMGSGLFSGIVYGTDPIVKMVLAGGIFTVVIGTIVGTYAGFVGGNTDRILMTLSDIAMTLPGLPLIIVIAAILNPESPYVVGILVSINAWGGLARSIRSEVLSVRDLSYVEASRSMGIYTPVIINKDIIPNILPYVLINLVNAGRRVIFAAVGLYFLGFLPYTSANWGVMLNQAYNNGALIYETRFHWIIAPMMAIILFSVGLILLSQSLDRVANPRIRAKHAKTVEEDDEHAV